jgi:polysaccharide biosynthesis transport protein
MFKRYWWMLLVMAPLGALAGLLVAAVITYMMPKKYESEAIIQVMPHSQPAGIASSGPQPATEVEILKSRKALEQVAANLQLPNRWSVDKETAIGFLKGIVKTQRIHGTELISIRVRHTNRVDARDIAGEVVSVYKALREETKGRESEHYVQEFSKMIRDQEDKVEERRKALAAIVRAKGIIYRGPNGVLPDERASPEEFHQLEQQKLQLESQISSLRKYENEQRMAYASGLDLPNNLIRILYPQYLEAKRQLDDLKRNGAGDDDPSVRAMVGRIEEIKIQLDEGVVNLRATLHAQLDLTNERLTGTGIPKSHFDAQDYVEAKRGFETEQEVLQQLKLKLIGANISRKIPSDSVQIHDEPVIAQVPISPNVTLNLLLGVGLGFLLSPLMALPVMWLLSRSRPVATIPNSVSI